MLRRHATQIDPSLYQKQNANRTYIPGDTVFLYSFGGLLMPHTCAAVRKIHKTHHTAYFQILFVQKNSYFRRDQLALSFVNIV